MITLIKVGDTTKDSVTICSKKDCVNPNVWNFERSEFVNCVGNINADIFNDCVTCTHFTGIDNYRSITPK